MPVPSREVVTCRLVYDCDAEWDDDEDSRPPPSLRSLPPETRCQIWRYLLRLDHNREPHSRPVPEGAIQHLLRLDSRRILEAPQFQHKGKQEINGILPLTCSCRLHPAILRTCRDIYAEASSVMYVENKVFAVQCGIRGLGARLRNYGIPMFGPIASHRDGQNLMHALWIMVKCPFARAMRFDVHLTASPKYHSLSLADNFVRGSLLPWMHNHIDVIGMENMADPRREPLQNCLEKHRRESVSKSNVYTYNIVCSFLEQVKDAADAAVENGLYTRAEDLYELVSYEACSIVRTRTGKLVDVSTKTTNGINRVCKLVAISAFRLCELRSGAITTFKQYHRSALTTPCPSPKAEVTEEQALDILPKAEATAEPPDALDKGSGTTRLKGVMAIEHAIMAGLLALRLPCATPIPEWNIRLNLMLLYLFTQYGDMANALLCIRHLHATCEALLNDARTKEKKGLKWDCLAALVHALSTQSSRVLRDKERKQECQLLVEQGQDCVRRLWGERLVPKKGYTGLIWTFRWA
ncbi:hypothetical protein DV735_g1328, partial [Chaetothyriales sp. CBS 134920]